MMTSLLTLMALGTLQHAQKEWCLSLSSECCQADERQNGSAEERPPFFVYKYVVHNHIPYNSPSPFSYHSPSSTLPSKLSHRYMNIMRRSASNFTMLLCFILFSTLR